MKRREFIALLRAAAVGWPFAARARQAGMPVIGFLSAGSAAERRHLVAAFRLGLKEAGYIEGQNVAIEFRWAEDRYDQLPALAAELIARQVAVIITNGPATMVAKSATTTIPIVFSGVGVDPVASGLVASMNRPGGNITGIGLLSGMLSGKRLEALRELTPNATLIGFFKNPRNPNADSYAGELQSAAHSMGQRIDTFNASTASEIDAAFVSLAERQVKSIIVMNDAFFNSRPSQFATLALRHVIPGIYPYREYVTAGGLMSYGPSLADAYRHAGSYAGQILSGSKPAELPVQQAVKIELVVNLRTAKALGLTLPTALLVRADEVIE